MGRGNRRNTNCVRNVIETLHGLARSMNYSSKVDEYNRQVHGLEKKDYSELVEKLVSLK
jgi:hypothetical protein